MTDRALIFVAQPQFAWESDPNRNGAAPGESVIGVQDAWR